jgi:hypothetical protein
VGAITTLEFDRSERSTYRLIARALRPDLDAGLIPNSACVIRLEVHADGRDESPDDLIAGPPLMLTLMRPVIEDLLVSVVEAGRTLRVDQVDPRAGPQN